jgi:hypothetical protein
MPEALPTPLATLAVPEVFPVSAIAVFQGCHLKLIASTRDFRGMHLATGPDAVIGSVVHRVMELWTTELTEIDAGKLFDREIRVEGEKLSKDPQRAHFADLPSTRSFMDWRNLRLKVKANCQILTRRSVNPTIGNSYQSHAIRPGAESYFPSPKLRLVGRTDQIDRIGKDEFRIRDYKTGRIFDSDDQMLPSISLQLRLYALLAEEADPNANITLSVIDLANSEFPVEWNRSVRNETRAALKETLEGIPANSSVNGAAISKPGNECFHCPVRHRCTGYLQTAPEWWKEFPFGLDSVPADTWGTITAIEPNDDGVSLQISDAAGRPTRIDRLRRRPGLDALKIGDRVYCFGLEKTGTGRGWSGKPFHPHAFHELSPDPLTRRAWATVIYK